MRSTAVEPPGCFWEPPTLCARVFVAWHNSVKEVHIMSSEATYLLIERTKIIKGKKFIYYYINKYLHSTIKIFHPHNFQKCGDINILAEDFRWSVSQKDAFTLHPREGWLNDVPHFLMRLQLLIDWRASQRRL